MNIEEVGTQVLKKKDKETKEKSKKDNKRTEKRKVEDGSVIVESNGHVGEGGENESGKGSESEIFLPNNHVGSANFVTDKGAGRKKKKEKKTKRGEQQNPDELQTGIVQGSGGNICFGAENMDAAQLTEHAMLGESVEPFSEGAFESVEKEEKRKKLKRKKDKSKEGEICEKSNEPGESVEAFGESQALEGVEKEEKRKKLKRKRDKSKEQEMCEKSNEPGESVEAFGESQALEGVEKEEKRKKLKRKRDKSKEQEMCEKSIEPSESVGAFGECHALEGVEKEEKRKMKRKKDASIVSEGDVHGHSSTALSDVSKDEKKRKKKSKKDKGESGSGADTTMDLEFDGHLNDGTKNKKGKAESDDVGPKDPKPKKSKKKVSFSGKDEVFQLPEDNLVRGKRFSKEEDEMVKEAVFNYIETNCLGEEGLQMVLNCNSHPKIRNCWKEIGAALPHRPQSAVYYRAHILFRRDEKRKWTKEEIEILRASQKKFGNQWRAVADELGKHRVHVKDTWRRIRHENLKKGRWSQEEYQTLFDLVNLDLRMKYAEEKKSKHGMLRDNVPWTAISDRLTTRAEPTCCFKWYSQLTSAMVTNGDWADSDDYRMIDALYELDASCYEDVDWDNLLEHRSGTICQKRWSEMVLHIGENMNKSFANQVEVLAKRYCPELLEAKEDWESKPVVL